MVAHLQSPRVLCILHTMAYLNRESSDTPLTALSLLMPNINGTFRLLDEHDRVYEGCEELIGLTIEQPASTPNSLTLLYKEDYSGAMYLKDINSFFIGGSVLWGSEEKIFYALEHEYRHKQWHSLSQHDRDAITEDINNLQATNPQLWKRFMQVADRLILEEGYYENAHAKPDYIKRQGQLYRDRFSLEQLINEIFSQGTPTDHIRPQGSIIYDAQHLAKELCDNLSSCRKHIDTCNERLRQDGPKLEEGFYVLRHKVLEYDLGQQGKRRGQYR